MYHLHSLTPNFPSICSFLFLCTVGSFSEHLDQVNGRSESVDGTDNSKPPSEVASHVARQRLESTEKKKISGKVTKSLSASALSLMIPGGRDKSFCLKCYDLCMLDVLWCKCKTLKIPELILCHTFPVSLVHMCAVSYSSHVTTEGPSVTNKNVF